MRGEPVCIIDARGDSSTSSSLFGSSAIVDFNPGIKSSMQPDDGVSALPPVTVETMVPEDTTSTSTRMIHGFLRKPGQSYEQSSRVKGKRRSTQEG